MDPRATMLRFGPLTGRPRQGETLSTRSKVKHHGPAIDPRITQIAPGSVKLFSRIEFFVSGFLRGKKKKDVK